MKLKRPLVILDLETTGTWVEKDKIIEIGMVRSLPDGTQTTYEKRINPGMKIPPEVSELTGIKDEDVKDAPAFRNVAAEIVKFFDGADLGGFNVERFDLPVLARELSEKGYSFDYRQRDIYDAQKVFHLHEKRDLTSAYAFFCGKELDGAHSALADSQATLEVLESQIRKYCDGASEIETLKAFEYQKRSHFYDKGRKFRWWNGELYMMFGKYAAKESLKKVAEMDRPYLEWIISKDFSDEVKELCENALLGKFPECPQSASSNDRQDETAAE